MKYIPPKVFTTAITVGSSDADYTTDGTADDVQIQAAIDAASDAGGGVVFIKEGSYDIASKVTIGSNISLILDKKAVMLKSSSSAVGFENDDTTNGNTNITIEGGEFDADFTPSAKGSNDGFINFNKVTHSRIANVYIHNSDNDGIKLTNSDNNTIENPRIENVSGDAIFVSRGSGTSFNNRIINPYVFNTWDDGIDIQGNGCILLGGYVDTTLEDAVYINTSASNCRVIGTEITNVKSGFNGVNISSSAGSGNALVAVNAHDNVSTGINVGADNCSVVDCLANDNATGINQAAGSDNCYFANNHATGNSSANYSLSGTTKNYLINDSEDNRLTGKLGIGDGSTIESILNTYQDDSQTGNSVGFKIEQDGTGDASMQFQLTGVRRWALGIDNSDTDAFKISRSTDVGTDTSFIFTTGGRMGIGDLDHSDVTNKLTLPEGTTAAEGIGLGTDTNLYRSGSDTLKTDDAFEADTISTPAGSATLGVGASTFAVNSNVMTITGDSGGNTVATITGASSGMRLTLIFVDSNVAITDDDTHGADSIDLSASFTSADDTVLELVYDGTSWYEVSRSVN